MSDYMKPTGKAEPLGTLSLALNQAHRQPESQFLYL